MQRKETEQKEELATIIEDRIDKASEEKKSSEEKPVQTRSEFLREREKKNKEREKMILEAQKQLASKSSIESVRRVRKILYGEIIGTQTIVDEEKEKICATIKMIEDESVIMFVPFEDMYTFSPLDMSTADETTEDGRRRIQVRKEQMLAKLITLKIPVTIQKVIQGKEGGNGSIFASRADACRIQMQRAYRTDNPQIRKGETYDATVLSVSDFSMAVTLGGTDFILPLSRLTNRYITNLQNVYAPGDKIPVLVNGIREEDERIIIDPDTITPELIEAQSRWYMIGPGTRAHATVTKVLPSQTGKGITIRAWIEGYNMPCKIQFMNANDFGREPISGDSIRIQVRGFLPGKYIDAVCIGVNGTAGYFNR